jgi:DNA-binding transcriptional ArsR family regulator
MAETLNPKAVLRLYRRGYTDAMIARRVGVSRITVGRWRRAAGLPSNIASPLSRRRRSLWERRSYRAGKLGGAHVRRAQAGRESWALGWTWPLSPSERRACEALLGGPLTAKQILARCPGMHRSNLDRTLYRLRDQGAVVAPEPEKRGRSRVYSLAPAVTKRGQVSA